MCWISWYILSNSKKLNLRYRRGHVKTIHPLANSIPPEKKKERKKNTLRSQDTANPAAWHLGISPSTVHIPRDRDKTAVQVPTSLSNPPFSSNQFLGLDHSGKRVGNYSIRAEPDAMGTCANRYDSVIMEYTVSCCWSDGYFFVSPLAYCMYSFYFL
ncbi:hypothetical protein B9Z19DRAFT_1070560 [Tuber borchii]|uniref:Uncharacterized protein n=1 Tax=Tuber borchii TaxID=42251 RepID=A0A2T7A965_TUBBO|nr:hypothetical protein B9Z19DRAFT_1070560 [Tuber borchii]